METQGAVPRHGPLEVATKRIAFGYRDGVALPVDPAGDGPVNAPTFDQEGNILPTIVEVETDGADDGAGVGVLEVETPGPLFEPASELD